MKVTSVRYERLINLGNYENEKYCIEVSVEEGDTAKAAFRAAQAAIAEQMRPDMDSALGPADPNQPELPF